uniref:tRNA(Ile)-lysidine synthase n=1 Tax=Candidatus Kentrum sp. MB TaxID=2138164 RepID=A0A450XV95_9GAMM|nr:MAG: tRNA(Ile)-lysidine synthase [Candidatus Kentron sp. MB]VFK76044.1 MAG: tRNA(Ile)-lysidine synthase [Candidatus Kentron sp. MB]
MLPDELSKDNRDCLEPQVVYFRVMYRKVSSASNEGASSLVPMLVLDALRKMPGTRRYRIAYSGGMDSHALLHVVARSRDALGEAEVSAIHINHGLQANANEWAEHAWLVCRDLDVPCEILMIDARPESGESPEAAARRARYGAIKAIMEKDEILLTAHHLDDQAETLLMQMVRGAGPHGLAGMPTLARFGMGWLGRPLLGIAREALRDYALSQGLCWIEDESNDDTRFARNYLRHEILPRLRARWPSVAVTLGRAALHQAQAAEQLDRLAKEDLARLYGSADDVLSCERLRRLPDYRQRNALHRWFRDLGLPVPNAAHMERILRDVVDAGSDRTPLIRWSGAEVRRYRDELYAGSPLPTWNPTQSICWRLTERLSLPHGTIEALRTHGAGLRVASCPDDRVEVGFRRGGERCRIGANGCTHRLKKLFQESGIRPWERDRIPLIFIEGELAAVAGLWVCHPFEASGDEPGWIFRWSPSYRYPPFNQSRHSVNR